MDDLRIELQAPVATVKADFYCKAIDVSLYPSLLHSLYVISRLALNNYNSVNLFDTLLVFSFANSDYLNAIKFVCIN